MVVDCAEAACAATATRTAAMTKGSLITLSSM
jgi:hypothetical protein